MDTTRYSWVLLRLWGWVDITIHPGKQRRQSTDHAVRSWSDRDTYNKDQIIRNYLNRIKYVLIRHIAREPYVRRRIIHTHWDPSSRPSPQHVFTLTHTCGTLWGELLSSCNGWTSSVRVIRNRASQAYCNGINCSVRWLLERNYRSNSIPVRERYLSSNDHRVCVL